MTGVRGRCDEPSDPDGRTRSRRSLCISLTRVPTPGATQRRSRRRNRRQRALCRCGRAGADELRHLVPASARTDRYRRHGPGMPCVPRSGWSDRRRNVEHTVVLIDCGRLEEGFVGRDASSLPDVARRGSRPQVPSRRRQPHRQRLDDGPAIELPDTWRERHASACFPLTQDEICPNSEHLRHCLEICRSSAVCFRKPIPVRWFALRCGGYVSGRQIAWFGSRGRGDRTGGSAQE
jgi:hypothetical protein